MQQVAPRVAQPPARATASAARTNPQLADLRDRGALGQDADVVIMLDQAKETAGR